MLVTVACAGLMVSDRYENSDCLTCYSVDKGIVVGCRTLPFSAFSRDERASALAGVGVTVLICGSITSADARLLQQAGIEVVDGQAGPAPGALQNFLAATLSGEEDCFSEDE